MVPPYRAYRRRCAPSRIAAAWPPAAALDRSRHRRRPRRRLARPVSRHAAAACRSARTRAPSSLLPPTPTSRRQPQRSWSASAALGGCSRPTARARPRLPAALAPAASAAVLLARPTNRCRSRGALSPTGRPASCSSPAAQRSARRRRAPPPPPRHRLRSPPRPPSGWPPGPARASASCSASRTSCKRGCARRCHRATRPCATWACRASGTRGTAARRAPCGARSARSPRAVWPVGIYWVPRGRSVTRDVMKSNQVKCIRWRRCVRSRTFGCAPAAAAASADVTVAREPRRPAAWIGLREGLRGDAAACQQRRPLRSVAIHKIQNPVC